MNPSIELISIGDELLSGRTLNRHAQTLGTALAQIGLTLGRDTTIPDESPVIQSAVKEAFERVDIVVVSGGLGPTVDDITRDALAQMFKRKLVVSPEALDAIKKRYAAIGRVVAPASERMALILEGADPLINSAGAAVAQQVVPNNGKTRQAPSGPGSDSGKTLFVVPGPPKEFAAVLQDHIVPWLSQTFPDARSLELCVLTTQGIGESDIVTLLEEAEFRPSSAPREREGKISMGFYPGFGKVEIRLSAPAEQTAALHAAEHTLRHLLKDYLIN